LPAGVFAFFSSLRAALPTEGDERGSAMTDTEEATGSRSNEISRGLVVLTKARTGKGPTKTRTYINDDLVVCVLRNGMTQAEKTLVAEGNRQTVRQLRANLQSSFQPEAVEMVERTMERKVVSFMSSDDVDNDVAAELFVLEPLPEVS
jgi:uncharacterized protein YbcI